MNKSKKNTEDSDSSNESETNNILDDNDNDNYYTNDNDEDDEIEENTEDFFEEDEDEYSDKINFNNFENIESEILTNTEDRITIPILSKYEKVRLLSTRAKIISEGGKPLIKNYYNLSEIKIAEEELKNKIIPYKIKRVLPNGKYEIWDPNTELDDFNN